MCKDVNKYVTTYNSTMAFRVYVYVWGEGVTDLAQILVGLGAVSAL